MTARATCASCRWWANDRKDGKEHWGDCKRHAPHPTLAWFIRNTTAPSDLNADWPRTEVGDWCGEHAPREKGDE